MKPPVRVGERVLVPSNARLRRVSIEVTKIMRVQDDNWCVWGRTLTRAGGYRGGFTVTVVRPNDQVEWI